MGRSRCGIKNAAIDPGPQNTFPVVFHNNNIYSRLGGGGRWDTPLGQQFCVFESTRSTFERNSSKSPIRWSTYSMFPYVYFTFSSLDIFDSNLFKFEYVLTIFKDYKFASITSAWDIVYIMVRLL